MHVYSKNIVVYIQTLKKYVKDIIKNEVGLQVRGERFLNAKGTCSYPIKVVIYNNKSSLGYFESGFFELGFHVQLMKLSKKDLLNLVRHEVAHYIHFIESGPIDKSHSVEFRNICKRFGWGKEVYEACMEVEIHDETDVEEDTVLRKVKKLMALSTSSNAHEAEQAMIKSQQLLQKHNLDAHQERNSDEQIVLMRILKQPREDAKMRAIAQILSTFYVNTIYNRDKENTYLEISGLLVNVEIAEYIASVLVYELDNLWVKCTQKTFITSLVAKNSFFTGLAKGYCDKVNALKHETGSENQSALMVIENCLIDMRDLIYDNRLKAKTSKHKFCPTSSSLGEKMGKELSLKPGIKSSSAHSKFLLT